MPVELKTVDPAWAWAPFQPSPEAPWNSGRAAHLLRRIGFAGTPQEITQALESSPQELVKRLVEVRSETADHQAEFDNLSQAAVATGNPRQLSAWWLHRLLSSPDVVREKTTLFWHGHFATSAEKVQDARLMLEQNELLRTHALTEFGPLAHSISKDPAMLMYLDSVTNRKAHPNENYAREVMELFCLGEGEYTEQDIRELARCFTGWEIRREKFRFNSYQHDNGTKQVLTAKEIESGEEGVDVVLQQQACPRFLCRKLVQFFLFDEPVPPADFLAPLVDELRANDLHIGPTVSRILASNLCFSEHAQGRKIRSPVELAVGLLRSLQGTTNVFDLSEGLRGLGQELFYPPNVKGWDGGRTWINSSTLLGRANFVRRVLDHPATRFGRQTLAEQCQSLGWETGPRFVTGIVEMLFAVSPSTTVQKQVADLIDAGEGEVNSRYKDALHWLCSLPEFQLA